MYIWGIPVFHITVFLVFLSILLNFYSSIKNILTNKDSRYSSKRILFCAGLLVISTLLLVLGQIIVPLSIYRYPVKTIPFPTELEAGYRDCVKEAVRFYHFKEDEPFVDGFMEKLKRFTSPKLILKKFSRFCLYFWRIKSIHPNMICLLYPANMPLVISWKLFTNGKRANPDLTKDKIRETILSLQALKNQLAESFKQSIGSEEIEGNSLAKFNFQIDQEMFIILNPLREDYPPPFTPYSVEKITDRFFRICSIVKTALQKDGNLLSFDTGYCYLHQQKIDEKYWKDNAPDVFGRVISDYRDELSKKYVNNNSRLFEEYDLSKIHHPFIPRYTYIGGFNRFYPPVIQNLSSKRIFLIKGMLELGLMNQMIENPDSYNELIHLYTRKWEQKESAKKLAHQELVASCNIVVTTEDIRQFLSSYPRDHDLHDYEKIKNQAMKYFMAVQSVVEKKMSPQSAISSILEVTDPDPLLRLSLELADSRYLEEVRQMVPASPEDLNEKNLLRSKILVENYLIVKAIFPDVEIVEKDKRNVWRDMYEKIIRDYVKENIAGKRAEFMDIKPEDITM